MRCHHSGVAAPQNEIEYDSKFKIDQLRHVLPYLCKELTGAIRLADIPIAARCSRFALIAAQRIGGDDDDRNGAQHRIGLEAASHFVSVKHGNLNVDLDRREVQVDGRIVELTDVEFRMLVAVLEAKGRVLSRNQLVQTIYDADRDVLGRTVDVTIRRIRAKLGDDPGSPRFIATVRGAGYRAAPESGSRQ